MGPHAARRVHLAQRALAPVPLARIGGYDLLSELGRGSYGVVYRSRRADLGHEVAVKVIPVATPRRRQRFLREANALLRIQHPHVLRVLDAGEERGHLYLVTDLVEGESLGDRLRRAGALSAEESAQIVLQLADGVAQAHAAAILHRDLKPDNVLLDADGARLGDFGLAKDLEDDRMTRSGATLGTPGYWPPEQARGEPATVQSDVYGLGAILHACRTGSAPGKGGVPPHDPRLDAIQARCLALDPADRYPDAAALAGELEDYLRRPGVPAQRSFLVGGVIGVLATAVGVVMAAVVFQSAPPPVIEDGATPIFGGQGNEQRDEHLLTAIEFAKAGSWGEAERALSRALEYDTEHAPIWTQRGRARREQGKVDGATSDLRRAIELAPSDPRPWFQLGLISIAQGNTKEAHEAFDQAVKRRPPPGELRSRAFNNRGLCRLKLKRWAEAAKDFDEAAAANPRNTRAHFNGGLAYQQLKNHPAAIEAFTRALQIDPGYFKAAYGRAHSKVELERYKPAIKDYSRCLKIDPSAHDIYRQRARAHMLARDPTSALRDIERAIQHRPNDPVAHLHLALILKALGRHQASIEAGAKALTLGPSPRLKRAIEGVMERARRLLEARPQR